MTYSYENLKLWLTGFLSAVGGAALQYVATHNPIGLFLPH